MGTWGTAILENDTALDVAGEFKDYIADGMSIEEAEDQLIEDFCIDDEEEDIFGQQPPFWLGLAAQQVKQGRLSERTKANALRIIDEGIDIALWQQSSPEDVRKRQAALDKLRKQITGPQKKPTKVRKPFVDNIEWEEGDGLAYQLPSGMWTAFIVLNVRRTKRDQSADYEVLDILQADIPSAKAIRKAPRRLSKATIMNLERGGLIRPPITGMYPGLTTNEIRDRLKQHKIKKNKYARYSMSMSVFSMSRTNKSDGPTGAMRKVTSGIRNRFPTLAGGYVFGDWKDLDAHLEKDYDLK